MFLNDLFTVTAKYKPCLACIQNIRKKKKQKKKNTVTNGGNKCRGESIQQQMYNKKARQLYGWCNFYL